LHIAFLLLELQAFTCFRIKGIHCDLRITLLSADHIVNIRSQGPLDVDGFILRVSLFIPVLPRSFANAGDLSFVRKVSETDTADAEVAQICVRTSADFTTIVVAG